MCIGFSYYLQFTGLGRCPAQHNFVRYWLCPKLFFTGLQLRSDSSFQHQTFCMVYCTIVGYGYEKVSSSCITRVAHESPKLHGVRNSITSSSGDFCKCHRTGCKNSLIQALLTTCNSLCYKNRLCNTFSLIMIIIIMVTSKINHTISI